MPPCSRLLVAIVLLAWPAGAAAQGIAKTLDELRLLTRPGQTVTLTGTDGTEVTGRILSLTAAAIEVQAGETPRRWEEGDVRTIRQRLPDPLGNGALWGLGVGAGLMLLGVAAVGVEEGDAGWAALAVAVYGGIGAAIGTGIDALIRSKQVIYEKPATSARWRLAPMLTPTAGGARLSFRF